MAARLKAGKPKGRKAIRAFHRQAIIEATVDSIVQHGFAATSISKIVEKAGLARAMVNIYFQSKEQLLVEVLRYKADQYNDYWKRAIARCGPSPEDELKALVEADLHPKILNRRNMAFWFAFRGEAQSKPEYIPFCTTRDHTLREAFIGVFSQLIPAEQVEGLSAQEMASGVMLLMEGMWLDFYLHPESFDRQAAKRICFGFLVALFPSQLSMDNAGSLTSGAADQRAPESLPPTL